MMNRSLINIVTFSLIMISSSCISPKKECKVDKKFEALFYKKIQEVINYNVADSMLAETSIKSAMELSAIVGCTTDIDYDYRGRAYRMRGILKNLHQWAEWYNRNKCTYTVTEAQLIINKFNHKLDSITKAIESRNEWEVINHTP